MRRVLGLIGGLALLGCGGEAGDGGGTPTGGSTASTTTGGAAPAAELHSSLPGRWRLRARACGLGNPSLRAVSGWGDCVCRAAGSQRGARAHICQFE